ncbi:MAG: hypothetical protein AB1486_17245 [Planctomycetota bacterium]
MWRKSLVIMVSCLLASSLGAAAGAPGGNGSEPTRAQQPAADKKPEKVATPHRSVERPQVVARSKPALPEVHCATPRRVRLVVAGPRQHVRLEGKALDNVTAGCLIENDKMVKGVAVRIDAKDRRSCEVSFNPTVYARPSTYQLGLVSGEKTVIVPLDILRIRVVEADEVDLQTPQRPPSQRTRADRSESPVRTPASSSASIPPAPGRDSARAEGVAERLRTGEEAVQGHDKAVDVSDHAASA